MDNSEFKTLMEVAAHWSEITPKNQYPWQTKSVSQSVKGPMGVMAVPKGMPALKSKTTRFVSYTEIEMPDPSLIHKGEVAQYIAALSPVILTEEKTPDGKRKIFDGRHRAAAWIGAGYTEIPYVVTTETEYKE